MSVELEQVFEGAYFRQGDRTIRIQEHDFANMPALCKGLNPILITSAELSLLGFSFMNSNTGTYSRATEQGKIFWLKAGTSSRWLIGIDDHLTTMGIEHIHQLQRIYFGLYEEHIRYSKDKIKPVAKGPEYQIKPYTETVFIDEGPVDTAKGQKHRSRSGHHQEVTIPDEPYYLTNDCRLLIRTSNYAIWRVSEKSPLFELGGKQFGLTLERGSNVTEDHRIAAGKWLKNHFLNNKISV